MTIGDSVIYTGERSPDFPPAAYEGIIVKEDHDTFTVCWNDGAIYEHAARDLAPRDE